MKLIMAIVMMFSLVGPVFADDNTDPALADRIAAAQARLKAKQAAATQPASMTIAEAADLRSEVESLRAENARLKAELAQLKVAVAKQADAPAQAAAPQDDIAAAIKQHKIINGMTVKQATQAVSVTFRKMSEGSDGESYYGANMAKQTNLQEIHGIEYRLQVQDGKIVSWTSGPVSLDVGTARVVPR